MAFLCKQDGNLHAGNSAANDGERLAPAHFLHDVFLLGEGHRVQGAVSLSHSVFQVHRRAGVRVVGHRQAGVVAGDARADVRFPALFQFGQVLAVADELPADRHRVDLPGLQRSLGGVRLHAPCHDDRDVDELLDVFGVGQSAPLDSRYEEADWNTDFKPGIWYNMPIERGDHIFWNGWLQPHEQYNALYDRMIDLYRSLPDAEDV